MNRLLNSISAFLTVGLAVAGFVALEAWVAPSSPAAAQAPIAAAAPDASSGSIEFAASVTPTDARPEPVRQFTFYLLRKSVADLHAEVEAADPPPVLDAFIDSLDVSPELKAWMKKNNTVELAGSDFMRKLTPDAILNVPEFMKAYVTYNSGYPGSGFPEIKSKPNDAVDYPDKYAIELKNYHAAVLRYATVNPETKEGMEAELTDINPNQKWFAAQNDERDRVDKRTLHLAQTQYLVAQTDSDLDGQGEMSGVPPGDYWLGTLGAVAQSGDVRQTWDVPVTVRAGQTANIELTNLNATVPPAAPER